MIINSYSMIEVNSYLMMELTLDRLTRLQVIILAFSSFPT
jgi:hypothetical protein